MDSELIRTISDSGFDWVLYDTEHGPFSMETVNEMIHRTSGAKASPIIRVVWDDVNAIKKALDTGTFGIIVPWVSNREMAENAVRYSKYPPEGVRGIASGRPAKAWGIPSLEYLQTANDELLIAIQIERQEALDNLEDILSVEGIDATWIGPADLSASLGCRGNPSHPKVQKAIDKVIEACNDAGVSPGIAAGGSVDYIKELLDRGLKFITIASDMGMSRLGCETFLERVKK